MAEPLSSLSADQLAAKALEYGDPRAYVAELQTRANQRDEAQAVGRKGIRLWTERAEAAEARLAETQKALEQIAMERPWPDVVMVDLVQVARDTLARSRAVLTTHPEAKP